MINKFFTIPNNEVLVAKINVNKLAYFITLKTDQAFKILSDEILGTLQDIFNMKMADRQFMIDFYHNGGLANISSLQGLESIVERFSLKQYPALKYYKEIREFFGRHLDDLDIEDKL